MTWLEVKAAIEAGGVKDEDEISYIDIGGRVTSVFRNERDDAWCVD